MHEVAVFFTDSNKRVYDLQQCIERECPEASYTRLKKRCDTRWVEKQAATLVFKEVYPAVVRSPENISEWFSDTSERCNVSPLHGSKFPALRGGPANSSRSHEASLCQTSGCISRHSASNRTRARLR